MMYAYLLTYIDNEFVCLLIMEFASRIYQKYLRHNDVENYLKFVLFNLEKCEFDVMPQRWSIPLL